MRLAKLCIAALLGAVIIVSCAPAPANTPPAMPSATATPGPTAIPHAAAIRFALVGKVTGGNVWATFDSQGYSYNDYAIRSAYWPRLYQLTVPDGRFETLAAAAMPSAVQPEGMLFAATVPLRPDLKWSDGSPFTADDVAFTVNTALAFQLGFDWRAAYDGEWLDHAEALDAHTVKFVFKRAPNVAVWQYGALQGPIVQKAFWQPKLAEASALLPPADSATRLQALSAQVALLQQSVDALLVSGATATGEQARQLQIQLLNQQGDLDQSRNNLAKTQAGFDASMQAARQALYALDGEGEPTLGTWLPAGQQDGAWVNQANPSAPFGAPNFDSAIYLLYADQAAAVAAVDKGAADAMLDPGGLSQAARSDLSSALTISENASAVAHFIVVNPSRPELSDPALHRALFCAISRASLVRAIDATPLTSLLGNPQSPWANPDAAVTCDNGYDPLLGPDEPYRAASILKSAGYTWTTEPAAGRPGAGLLQPGGVAVRPLALLAPDAASDPESAAAARFVERAAQALGIPLTVQTANPADIRYAVLNGHRYDLAIVGWRLAAYPGYLCDWFGLDNPLGYNNPQLAAECSALNGTSDLDAARQHLFVIQYILARNPPFLPVFAGKTYDITRGIVYPFDRVMNGLSGVYGAPSLAIPSAPPK